MDKSPEQIEQGIHSYITSIEKLQDLGILTNKKDFTSQIGEWLVETIYKGKRASNTNQKHWDVVIDGKKVQVKTHAKAITNPARFSSICHPDTEELDEVIIIVFTHNYKLKEWFKIPWLELKKHIVFRTAKLKPEISWNSIKEYSVNLNDLPCQNIISIFQ